MRFLKINDRNKAVEIYPFYVDELKRMYPYASFTKNPSVHELIKYSVFPVEETTPPDFDKKTQVVEESIPELVNGVYLQKWIVIDLDQSKIDLKIQDKWKSIRDERNRMLRDCDWTQISDVPFTTAQKNEWKAYRKALRDITKQKDPFNIVWPTPPTSTEP